LGSALTGLESTASCDDGAALANPLRPTLLFQGDTEDDHAVIVIQAADAPEVLIGLDPGVEVDQLGGIVVAALAAKGYTAQDRGVTVINGEDTARVALLKVNGEPITTVARLRYAHGEVGEPPEAGELGYGVEFAA